MAMVAVILFLIFALGLHPGRPTPLEPLKVGFRKVVKREVVARSPAKRLSRLQSGYG